MSDIIEKIVWSAFIVGVFGMMMVWAASFGWYCVTTLHDSTWDQVMSGIIATEAVVACVIMIAGGIYSIWTE